MTPYFSHSEKDDQGRVKGIKTICDHVDGVRTKALARLHPFLRLSVPSELLRRQVELICAFHDVGKYSSYFQSYLLGREKGDPKDRSHARIGALLAYDAVKQQSGEEEAYAAYFVILNHHRNLHTPLDFMRDPLLDDRRQDDFEYVRRQWRQLKDAATVIAAEIGVQVGAQPLDGLDRRQLRRHIRTWGQSPNASAERYFRLNYLFSLLTEADKLDASFTELYKMGPIREASVTEFLAQKKGEGPLYTLRNAARAEVLAHLQTADLLEKRMFILCAPTGIGKTLTALDFAVRLRAKIAQTQGYLPQIITALPFINIIEQTEEQYRKALEGENPRILAHYQYAEVFGEHAGQSTDEEQDEKQYAQNRMSLETWQADIVITSFVQLFQTLVSNRNQLLKKFNHLAGTILILDEVQSIRLELMPFAGAMLFFLGRYLNTRVLMMTATQPRILELADEVHLNKRGISAAGEALHLIAKPETYFAPFQRTQIIPVMEKAQTQDELIELWQAHWSPLQSCLIVVNTVNRSLSLFEALAKHLQGANLQNPLHYLSTNLIPAHRKCILDALRNDLRLGKKPILVSTQVVEAGVDLDFDIGFRDLAPIEAIVQVAGRINRENRAEKQLSPLYVFDLGEGSKIYGSVACAQARKALGTQPIPEPAYYALTQEYFRSITENWEKSRQLMEAVEQLRYETTAENEASIAKFQMIEESPYVESIFVEDPEQPAASKALEAFRNLMSATQAGRQQARAEFDRLYRSVFQQHCMAAPRFYIQDLPLAHSDSSLKYIPASNYGAWYRQPTGLVREAPGAASQCFFL